MTTAEKLDALRDDILAIKRRTEEIADATAKALVELETRLQRAIAEVQNEEDPPPT